jgi:hypothetical protein
MPWFTPEQRGPASLGAFLGAQEDAVPSDEMDRIAARIRAALDGQP